MRRKRKNSQKRVLLLAALATLLTCVISSTIAYLLTSADPIENKFAPAYVSSQVNETFANNEKSNVTIQNTGNISAYIRAAIVVTWKDANGHTMAEVPVLGTDYTLDLGAGWTSADGYYYYTQSVAAGASTTNLINSCEPIKGYEDGRKLCVEVIGSAIQDVGIPGETYTTAWTEAAK